MSTGMPASDDVFSVSALVGAAKRLLEQGFPSVAVEGEISNLARPRSGHIYFTLKDGGAQLRCALFRREAQRVGFPLADGMQVLARGRLSIYPARGDFQLYVADLEEAGLGALQRAFEQLKKKLQAEGLFDAGAKRPLPRYPRRIGVITSSTGAALRDILHVLRRRYPAAGVLIYPSQVQGAAAAPSLVRALETASARAECDVLLLARGGGSIEDLWAFNEESVARAIRSSRIPVVSGVGHETDFTIADFAADVRAPTPSAAAETVVPDAGELLARLSQSRGRLGHAWQRAERERRQTVATLRHRLELRHPQRRLQEGAQRLDELAGRLNAAPRRLVAARRARVETLRAELSRLSPARTLADLHQRFRRLDDNLARAGRSVLERRRAKLEVLGRSLQALGPEQTLARGYAIVFDSGGRVLRDASQVAPGDRVRARLARGRLRARVEERDEGDA